MLKKGNKRKTYSNAGLATLKAPLIVVELAVALLKDILEKGVLIREAALNSKVSAGKGV
jgi:hypothetical protein